MDGLRGEVRILVVVGLVALAPAATPGWGSPEEGTVSPLREGEREDETESRAGERRTRLFPVDDVFVESLAGPHRRGVGVSYVHLFDTDIPDTGDSLFGLMLGGRFGVLRVHPVDRPDRGWQIGIEAGFYGQFDIDRSYDNIGWDGFYGLALTTAMTGRWAAKVGVLHTSSHVGDEYAERTGRRRIGYTREELVFGVSRSIRERWRAQAEAGWGYDLRNEELQEPGRLAAGLEYLAPGTLGWAGWYAAVGGSTVEERDWQLDWAVDVGLLLSESPRRWRLGLAFYSGRAPLGEFFQRDQRVLSLGLWLDP